MLIGSLVSYFKVENSAHARMRFNESDAMSDDADDEPLSAMKASSPALSFYFPDEVTVCWLLLTNEFEVLRFARSDSF